MLTETGQTRAVLTQIGPFGSRMVCPRPSMLGDTEYALMMFSWSIVTALPEYGEKHIAVTTSARSFQSEGPRGGGRL